MHHRHDISDKLREKMGDKLPGNGKKKGRQDKIIVDLSMRLFWILRIGAPWRDLPPDYGEIGKTRTEGLVDGETAGFESIYWRLCV